MPLSVTDTDMAGFAVEKANDNEAGAVWSLMFL